MKKALSSTALLAKKYNLINWQGSWLDNFGQPELRGVWSVSGHSGSGKTSFLLQLAKELTKYGRVLYNSLEEGDSKTMQRAWKLHKIAECGRKIQLIQEGTSELTERLEKRQSPEIVITDTFQYTKMNWDQYWKLKNKFSNKLLIFNQQMDGNKIMMKTGIRVNYDADLKIWIEGFKAFSKGRSFGKNWQSGFVIWDEGERSYWGEKNKIIS